MSGQQRLFEQIEGLMSRVRAMEPGGDLDGLLERGIGEISQAIYQEALSVRAEATAQQAAFSPCGVPGVRRGKNPRRRPARASHPDDARGGGL